MSSRDSSQAASTSLPFGPRNRSWAIFLISVLGLFLEMLLIRWIGTEIRIFAYLQNTILIVCFFGLGMGCFTCRRPVSMRQMLVPLVAFTAILAAPFSRQIMAQITDMLSVMDDLLIWFNAEGQGGWQSAARVVTGLFLTFGLMILVWEIFLPVGRILGRLMDDHPHTIWAYSVNIAGSLVGIGLFVLLSVFYLPPVVWFLVAGVLLLAFLGAGRQKWGNLGLVAATVAAAWVAGLEPSAREVAWSPYQKLTLAPRPPRSKVLSGDHIITVNNIGYQGLLDLSEEGVRRNKHITKEMAGMSQYDIPLKMHAQPNRVLIVGAGAGNDVAGALRGGAQQVTAVEIDPAIIDMGRRHHPERPYDSAKVRVVNDDARSFFATTDEKYDLIIFGLLDSHTTTSMTNARLDHYVYTRQSINRARSLLTPGGVLALSFEARKPYIADRMARCLKEEFGEAPLVFRVPDSAAGWGGVMFVAGDGQAIRRHLDAQPKLASLIEQWQKEFPIKLTYTTRVATDDWPYIYLKTPKIPTLYFLLGGLMAALVYHSHRRLKIGEMAQHLKRPSWHFFFLGAAFLLLEVQNISKASVVLGNTWWVNAVIVSSILLMILLANLIEAKGPRIPQWIVTCCLIGTCLALYFIDLSQFAFLPYVWKACLVGLLSTLPILFSGIVFIRSFARTERKDLALGANLLGSLVGGFLQSITFVIGVKALLLVVAALYFAALLTQERQPRSDRSGGEPEQDAADPTGFDEHSTDEMETAEPMVV